MAAGAGGVGKRAPPLLMQAYLRDRADLVRAFAPRLGSREAAEELVQELGCKLAELTSDPEPDRPSAYLYRLAHNLMLDRRRADGRSRARDAAWRRENVVTLAGEPVSEEPPAERSIDARRRMDEVISLLRDLPPATRRAFELHKLEGRTHAETAALMGISRSGVEKHMMAALKLLMARMP